VKRTITISIEQLSRPQPGGIATYIRGLVTGLHDLADPSLDVVGLGSSGASFDGELALRVVKAPCGVRLLSRLWPIWPLGQRGALHCDARPFVARRTGDFDAGGNPFS
jgi:hypothetical protein